MKSTSLLTIISSIVIYTTTISCNDKKSYTPERIKSDKITIDSYLTEDQSITDLIKPYKEGIQSEMDSTLAYAPKSYSKKDSKYNTAIGNMMSDAVYEIANPIYKKRTGHSFDAVLLNYGGIRSSLSQGTITTRTAYEIMPFENELIVLEMTANQIHQMFDYLKSGTAHPFTGMTLQLDNTGAISKAQIQGKDIDTTKTYFIATSDYLKNGGDNMNFFSGSKSELLLDYKIRNVLIDYFKKKDTIAPLVDNRFTRDLK